MSKKVLNLLSPDKFFFLFIFFAFIVVAIHFVGLGNFPTGVNHDEAEVLLSARTGLPFPGGLFSTDTEAGISALPSMLMSFYFKIVPLNLFTARFLYVLVNIATGLILSLIIFKLSKQKVVSYIGFFVFMISPWSFVYGRATTEAPVGLFFMLLGVLLLFSLKGKFIYYSLLAFIASFFSYQGAKVVLPFLVIGFLLLHYKFINKTKLNHYVVYSIVFVVSIIFYFIIVFTYPGSTVVSRSPEFIFLNLDRYALLVDEARGSLIDTPFNNFFVNKFTFLLRDFMEKYLGIFSPSLLFLRGDPRSTYTFGEHGLLYIIDLVFILAGIIGIYKAKLELLGFVILLIAIFAPIGASLSLVEDSYIFRSGFILPVFVTLISFGIYFMFNLLKRRWKNIFIIGVFLVYTILFINFMHLFFVSFPVKQQENQYFSERILVSYLDRISDHGATAVVNSPLQIKNQYLFFNKVFNENIKLINNCPQDFNGIVAVQSGQKCSFDKSKIVIQNQKDSGSLFTIYGDVLCEEKTLKSYNRFHYFSDYDVESLSNEEFCKRLINKYEN